MTSPTEHTLSLLRGEGYIAAVVEHFNPWAKIRQDLFGFIDIVAIRSDVAGVLAVQTTSGANITSRIEKSMGKKELFIWLKAGNQFEVHGWRKMGKRGARKLWQVDRRKILKEMLH